MAASSARGYLCLQARPAEAEANLAFAVLGDLLAVHWPIVASDLPEPQRRALGAALLVEDVGDAIPDPRSVGVALLSTLRAIARERPVLVAIDDEQWVDQASATVLAFALRRLTNEPVAAIFARRGEHAREPIARRPGGHLHATSVELGPLSLGALHAIVVDRFGTVLSRPRLKRLHELSRGNPFLAMELVRAANAGRLSLESAEGVSADVDRLVGARLDALPPDTRRVLVCVAVASRPTVELLVDAVETEALTVLEPARSAGIVELSGSSVRFSHPLLASAAYASSTDAQRRTIRARLAELVEDPVERATHLAFATPSPDEQIAAEVEKAAGDVFRRGAPAAAASLAEHAVRLTPSDRPHDRERRAAARAEYLFEAGDTASAAALLESLIASVPRGIGRARLLAMLARVRHFGDDVETGTAINEEALADATGDDQLSASLHEGIAWGRFLMRDDVPEAARHAGLAVRAAERAGDDIALGEALAAQGLISLAVGKLDDSSIERAMGLEPAFRDLRVLRHPSYARGYALALTDRVSEARQVFVDLLRRADEQGDESATPSILVQLSMVEILAGDWGRAEEFARTGEELAGQSGQRPSEAALRGRRALVSVLRGELENADSLATTALALAGGGDTNGEALRRSFTRGGEIAAWALAAAHLARGRVKDANAIFEALVDTLLGAGIREPGELRFLPDAVEARLADNDQEGADRLVVELEEMARRTKRASTVGLAARCRALVLLRAGDLESGLRSAERAVANLEEVQLRFELARAQLVLGELQRRHKRKRAARGTLTAAVETFEELGAQGWAARARSELGRLGGRSASPDTLTPSESLVAELVAEGLANKEVAASLGISTKTVELHLSHIYAKLGIGSRTELVRLLAKPTKP